ncbi:hypothetical protein CgunFtcFv8_003460 [Champsocephalus gunnari]|uniref:Uncharacterized protein n=1 Tax=Champsocephalus gunnari TaxID=52237 RepID=A0AAN8DDB4_CHAGU|nr:hypothetical protein CgunFtcFv8_003460 [Champsocephalus gunnari]
MGSKAALPDAAAAVCTDRQTSCAEQDSMQHGAPLPAMCLQSGGLITGAEGSSTRARTAGGASGVCIIPHHRHPPTPLSYCDSFLHQHPHILLPFPNP